MSLKEKLEGGPILLEVIPPNRRASEKYVRSFVENHVKRALDYCEIDAINLPEVAEENFRGEPFYKNMDPRDFAAILRDECGDTEVVVNKIVVHCKSGAQELEEWASTALGDYGIRNVVAVGGNSSMYKYPGPTVIEANAILREAGLCCGNIMIPERYDEARRMLSKTESGAEFFTTQATFSTTRLLKTLGGYHSLCGKHRIKPAAVLVSLAPVSDRDDLDFVRWLGVDIGRLTERKLLADGPKGLPESSMDLAEAGWREILSQSPSYEGIPLGLNIEYISRHNFEYALQMARKLIGVSRTR